jgi:hypothetical protein
VEADWCIKVELSTTGAKIAKAGGSWEVKGQDATIVTNSYRTIAMEMKGDRSKERALLFSFRQKTTINQHLSPTVQVETKNQQVISKTKFR